MNVRAKALLWLVAVFLAGVISGAALTTLYYAGPPGGEAPSSVFNRHRRPENDQRAEAKTDRLLKAMVNRLDLDAQQQEELRKILEESRDLYRQASERSRDEFREIRSATRRKIRLILKPDQLPKFEEFVKHRKHKGPESGKSNPPKD